MQFSVRVQLICISFVSLDRQAIWSTGDRLHTDVSQFALVTRAYSKITFIPSPYTETPWNAQIRDLKWMDPILNQGFVWEVLRIRGKWLNMSCHISLYLPKINFKFTYINAGKARSMALKMTDASDAGGYMRTNSGSDLIDLSVEFLNGEGCRLKLEGSCTGREVYRMVSARLPNKVGQPKLYHGSWPLILHKALQEQSIVSRHASLSCTYVARNLYEHGALSKGSKSLRKRLHWREWPGLRVQQPPSIYHKLLHTWHWQRL